MTRGISTTVSILSSLLVLSACAATSTEEMRGRNRDVLTQEELQAVQASNLYEAIQRLRPRWLTVRSQQSFGTPTEIVVYQNQSYLGGAETLRNFGLDAASWVQYLDGTTAAATLPGLGTRQVEAAIVVHTGRRDP